MATGVLCTSIKEFAGITTFKVSKLITSSIVPFKGCEDLFQK
jgi:hypothetical protein